MVIRKLIKCNCTCTRTHQEKMSVFYHLQGYILREIEFWIIRSFEKLPFLENALNFNFVDFSTERIAKIRLKRRQILYFIEKLSLGKIARSSQNQKKT